MAEGKVRRVETPEVRRAQIIEAAKARFRSDGFHATTMADVAASAGVSVGLLYRYYPSKEEVIRAIVEADLQAQLGAVERGLDAHPGDQAAALASVIEGVIQLALDRDRTALMLEIAAETARSPVLSTTAQDVESQVAARLKARFGANMPPEEADSRIRVALGVFTTLGLEAYRLPGRRVGAVKVAKEFVRSLFGVRPGDAAL